MIINKKTTISLLLLLVIVACRKEKPPVNPENPSGKIVINFEHKVSNELLQKDTMKYFNAAGNPYEVNELKYFISDVTLYDINGNAFLIDDWTSIYYIDIDIPSTLSWQVFDKIPVGSYKGLSFIFGITPEKNKSFMFVNPPEVNMFWPEVLGGGYHYMMLNGKWKDLANVKRNFSFHLGIGQIYKNNVINTDSIIGFVHNHFKVNLLNTPFKLEKDSKKILKLTMNIESWFETPHVYNHNQWGGDIMQKQEAMNMAKENGIDAFSLSIQE